MTRNPKKNFKLALIEFESGNLKFESGNENRGKRDSLNNFKYDLIRRKHHIAKQYTQISSVVSFF